MTKCFDWATFQAAQTGVPNGIPAMAARQANRKRIRPPFRRIDAIKLATERKPFINGAF
jgi:hypothetical protein